jgi:hypothetical protein
MDLSGDGAAGPGRLKAADLAHPEEFAIHNQIRGFQATGISRYLVPSFST